MTIGIYKILNNQSWVSEDYDLKKAQLIAKKNFQAAGTKNKGKKASLETRAKLSIITSGKNNPMYGKKQSNLTKLKIGKANKNKLSGEKNPNVKLTEDDVRDIRKLFASGKYKYKNLAQRYNVSNSCIAFIVTKKSWKFVK